MWLADAFLTLRTVNKLGEEVEINPIVQNLLKTRGAYVWVFKVVEIAAFLYLIFYLSAFTTTMPFYILLVYILFYGVLVANNSRVYYKATGNQSKILRITFILLLLASISFIYLNYVLYRDLNVSYNSLRNCKSEYNDLFFECKKNTSETPENFSRELENRLGNLNLTVPTP